MKVGVLFPSRFEDPGEFLADARAMEAAGVDSVWLEEHSDGLDPMLVLAAIAAVTSQLRLGLLQTKPVEPNRVETLQQLSRERLISLVPSSLIGQFPSPHVGEGQGGGFPRPERWQRVEVPGDREAWADTLERAKNDADGVLVPMDPRLLDILRHPDEAIDRSDLLLAQG
jgi:hypothetical protein